MGFLMGGPYYDLIGRTGNNVGRRRKGKNVFSMRPSKSTKQPTILQLNQRLKFGLVTRWLSNALNVIQIGYQAYQTTGSSMNSAVKQVLDDAITGVSPNFALDYSRVQLSKGPLLGARNWVMSAIASAEVELTWDANVGSGKHNVTDKLIIFAFCPVVGEFLELIAPVTRGALAYTLSVPASMSTELLHVWISFMNHEEDVVSRSEFRSITLL
ncbi:MAG: DUF6266 family protein [Pedobacter sp.]